MQADKAIDYAERLSVLKFFPSSAVGILQVSKIIAEICVDESQADWLVSHLQRRFDEWPGPATLCRIWKEQFGPYESADESIPEDWKRERECDECSDLGFFLNRFRVYQKCSCTSAQYVTDEMLADYNKRLKPRDFVRVSDIKVRIQ
jgi:hypothetical protein